SAAHGQLVLALPAPPVQAERVREARAAAALDGDPQDRCLAFGLVGHQVADLGRCALGQSDESRLLNRCHGPIVAASSAVAHAPKEQDFVTPVSLTAPRFSVTSCHPAET